jgi:Coenzyme PQQ synthesis protein D (PqqD)
MDSRTRFRIDPAQVVDETIDGEAILLKLQTGDYYTLEGSGAEIWGRLAGGKTVGEVAGQLQELYGGPVEPIEAAVRELAEELAGEGLLEAAGELAATAELKGASPPEVRAEVNPGPFVSPILRKYTDMQELLLVDPIHEVDDAGWPAHPPAA